MLVLLSAVRNLLAVRKQETRTLHRTGLIRDRNVEHDSGANPRNIYGFQNSLGNLLT